MNSYAGLAGHAYSDTEDARLSKPSRWKTPGTRRKKYLKPDAFVVALVNPA